jgi:quaternary ammonium compound-resistance protein SugE
MPWLLLILAGLLEIGWAVSLKYTDGFTRWRPVLFFTIAMIASVILLGLAAKKLPIGTAYAVWTGIGAVGTAILGMILFNEPREWPRLVCIGLICAGIIGLRFMPAGQS